MTNTSWLTLTCWNCDFQKRLVSCWSCWTVICELVPPICILEFLLARCGNQVVAGRFINGYSTNDWMLGVIYRATFLTQGLAGLQAVNIPGIENVDVTEIVKGHSSYLSKVGDILQAIDIDSFYPTHPSKIRRRKLWYLCTELFYLPRFFSLPADCLRH